MPPAPRGPTAEGRGKAYQIAPSSSGLSPGAPKFKQSVEIRPAFFHCEPEKRPQ